MKNLRTVAATVVIALIFTITAMGLTGSTANAAHTLPVNLGTAAPFAILAGTPNITNSPTSVINGDVGLSPATGAGIGLTCAEVTGTIYSVDATGPLPCRVTNPGLLTTAKASLNAAIGDAAGRLGGLSVAANQLAGKNLKHGVYTAAAAMDLSVGGTLILDGENDPNAVFIFQLGTALTVGVGTTVSLINQAQSCNVFWKVDSAAIGTNATFSGTILAETTITVGANATVDGRLLARDERVTLISDTITRSTCSAPPVSALPPCEFTVNLPNMPCSGTRSTPTVASATQTPASAATATPIGTAAPTATPIGTAAPTAAAAAPTAAPASARVQVLPSTSTNDPLSPLLMLGIALAGIGFLVLRRQIRHS